MYRRILAAVDESMNAHAAARYAMAMAQACGATLCVAGVLTPTMTGTEKGAIAQSAGSLVSEAEERGVPVLGGPFDNAERAYVVSQLAAHFHPKLIVFHTLEEASQRGQAVPHEVGARQVRMFVDSLREAGTEPEVRIVTGPLVGEAIMQEAARHHHDLIIMGASQRSLFSKWRRGNPVENVMRRTPCDLFVCRSRRRV